MYKEKRHGSWSVPSVRVSNRCGESALGELKPLACTGLTVLLAFDLAGVAGQEVLIAQYGFERLIELVDRPAEAEENRAGLAGITAAAHVDVHVDAAFGPGFLKDVGQVLVIALLSALGACMWLGVWLHHRLARQPVDLPAPEDTQPRDPGMTLVLSVLSCRLYELYWQYDTTRQLRRLTGRPDLLPGLDLLLIFATLGLWQYWVAYRNAEAVDEAMARLGLPTAHRNTAIAMSLGTFVCGLCHWVLVFKLQEAYNQLFVERLDAE